MKLERTVRHDGLLSLEEGVALPLNLARRNRLGRARLHFVHAARDLYAARPLPHPYPHSDLGSRSGNWPGRRGPRVEEPSLSATIRQVPETYANSTPDRPFGKEHVGGKDVRSVGR